MADDVKVGEGDRASCAAENTDQAQIIARSSESPFVVVADGVEAGLDSNDVEGAGDVMEKQSALASMPKAVRLEPNIRLQPNITLGKGPQYIDFPIPIGIDLVYNGRIEDEEKGWRIEKIGDILRVTPLKDGEFRIPICYNGCERTTLLLTVNPNPWSLWQVREPGEDQIAFASDRDRLMERHCSLVHADYPSLQVVGASRRGRSHEHSGTFRDDDIGYWADERTGRFCLIVADGAGSCRFSREGARLAIRAIKEKLDANLSVESWAEDGFEQRADGIIGMKLAALANYANEQLKAFVTSENERHPDNLFRLNDFSTTLLIAALKRDDGGGMRLVTFSIGDGAIAWYTGEDYGLMCSPDAGEFSGGTRFLTTPEVWSRLYGSDSDEKWSWPAFCRARVHCKLFTPEEVRKLSVFVMSDGVSDPWFETDAGLHDYCRWKTFVDDTIMHDGENKAGVCLRDPAKTNAGKLLNWLNFKISGNHDDRTILAIFSRDEAEGNEVKSNAC